MTFSISSSARRDSPLKYDFIVVSSRPMMAIPARKPSETVLRNVGLPSAGPLPPSPCAPWHFTQPPFCSYVLRPSFAEAQEKCRRSVSAGGVRSSCRTKAMMWSISSPLKGLRARLRRPFISVSLLP